MTSSKTTRKQNVLVIIAALVLIGLSIGTTLYISGFLTGTSDGDGMALENISLGDAYTICHNMTKKRYNKRLKTLFMDNHSSRYEHKVGLYKVFLKADIYMNKNKFQPHWVNCFVRSSNGSISKYEVIRDKKAPDTPIRKNDGNIFGWP